jgi:hypothetical protein
MPTLRLIYLTEQYTGVTEDETNNKTAAVELPTTPRRIHEQSRFPIDDATRNTSSKNNKPAAGGGEEMEEQSDDHEEGDDYLDTLLQEAIDAVNRRSFGSHAAVQVPHEEMVASDEAESENDASSSEHLDAGVQQFQDEMVFSDEEIENDSTSSVHLDAIQQKSGRNKRKRTAPQQSFDDRFNHLMTFKAKYGHCDVSCIGDNAFLGQWCSVVRGSYKKMQNYQKPKIKLSDEQIRRLNDAGFKWCSLKRETPMKIFDERLNDLMTFKAKYGHCDVSCAGENASLGRWCSVVRGSYKKMQNYQKPKIKLSDEQIQRLNDADFKWCSLRKREITPMKRTFDERLNDLMTFKARYGHCDVSCISSENASLGRWCSVVVRGSYKKMQNNQKPVTNLSDEQIQYLSDAGFRWCR